MNIRIAAEQDYVQWLPLWKGYQTFYKTSIAEAVTQKTWTRFFDPAEPMHCAVAEQDGVLMGMVHYIFHVVAGLQKTTYTCKTCLPRQNCAAKGWDAP